ncbi:MAG: lysozyme [Terracidiphilus sp.]|nr:lysozyme [Terracidiphilus sp.]
MKLSAAGLDLIKRSEGFRSRTYFDAAGFPSIGYGHRLEHTEHYPGDITESQAEIILLWDVREAEQAVGHMVKVPLSQGQFDALVDFTFNLGSARLSSSTLLRELNQGHYDLAANELLRWAHCGAEELDGLKARRRAERALWLGEANAQAA